MTLAPDLGTHGTIRAHASYPRDTHSYKVERHLDYGVLVHLATGRSGRQKYWWPAVLQWREDRYGWGWAIVGQVNAGQPVYASSVWNSIRCNTLVGSSKQRFEFKGHAPSIEQGVNIMLAILQEYNS